CGRRAGRVRGEAHPGVPQADAGALRGTAMDFAFTPEQDELARAVRTYARKELAARSAHWDATGEFPWEAWRGMGELGLLGMRIPEAYGGQETDLLTMGIGMEEIGR